MKILKILILLYSFIVADGYEKNEYENHIYRSLDHLNLSKFQKNELKQILIEAKSQYKRFYIFKHKQDSKFKAIFLKDDFDTIKYTKVYLDIEFKSIDIYSKLLSKIHKVLNKKQRKQFSYYIKEWELE